MSEPFVDEDGVLLGGEGGLHPDHPLLARAQEALKKQLLSNKMRIEGELREKQNALRVSPFRLHTLEFSDVYVGLG